MFGHADPAGYYCTSSHILNCNSRIPILSWVFQPRKRYEGWWRGTVRGWDLVEDEEALKRTESRTGSRARDVQIAGSLKPGSGGGWDGIRRPRKGFL